MKKNKQTESQENRFTQLDAEISQELQSLKKLNINLKYKKNEDIKSMIKHYLDLTNSLEDRRTRIRNYTFQMLAICASAAVILYTQKEKINQDLFWIIELVLSVQIIFSIYAAVVYEKQSIYRYAFKQPNMDKFGNRWKWFYYGMHEVQEINTHAFRNVNDFNKTVEPYLRGLKRFILNYTLEDINEEISNNIIQLYLLQVHNYYKNKFYTQLTKIWQWSLYSIPVCIVLGILFALILN